MSMFYLILNWHIVQNILYGITIKIIEMPNKIRELPFSMS